MLGHWRAPVSLYYMSTCSFALNHLHPNFYNQKLLLLPIQSSPLFPFNSYCFRVHEGLHHFLTSNKVNYLTTFLHRTGTPPLKRVELKSTKVKRQFKKIALTGGKSTKETVKEQFEESAKHFENIADQVKKVVQLEALDNMQHFNVAFDANLTSKETFYYASDQAQLEDNVDKGVLMVSELNQVYSVGTLCKLYLKQTTNSFGNKIDIGILRGLQQIEIDTTNSQPFQPNSIPNPFLKLLFGLKQKEQEESQQQFQNIPSDLEEILTFVKVKPLHLDLNINDEIKKNEDKLAVENISEYKAKMKKIIETYKKLQTISSINTPNLIFSPFDPRSLDLLCGYICQTSYFSNEQLQGLFEVISKEMRVMKRVDLCLKLFNEYLQAIEKLNPADPPQTSSPSTEHLEKIYKFLQRTTQQGDLSSQSSPQKKIEQDFEKIKEHLPEILKKHCETMLSRLSDLATSDPEFSKSVQYLSYICSLPFAVRTVDSTDLMNCKKILDEDHYGLKQVKTLVVEFLAERFLKEERKAQGNGGKSLLLIGPPGVGKSSIAQSIARSLGRKFIRISVSGETDISAITGHRRTYISSHAGKIITALKMSGSMNPVILIDEVDKCGGGARDALANVFGDERKKWKDNWIDHDIDLSDALIIGTANWAEKIPDALRDRAQVVEMMGYTAEEKKNIAQGYLIPKVFEKVKTSGVQISPEVIDRLVEGYCREPGVRNLERFIDKIARKVCMKIASTQVNPSEIVVKEDELQKYVGLPVFDKQLMYALKPPAGIVIALAYNQYGGSIMFIETLSLKNGTPGKLKITGSLGKVMMESVDIAFTFVKQFLDRFPNNNLLNENEIHIHFPEGASPKDGPSAGIAIATSLISLALNKPMEIETGMTGELSLTGRVLQIGGIKEKLLALRREKISNIILPLANKEDVEVLDDYLKEGINFNFVENYQQVFSKVFPSIV